MDNTRRMNKMRENTMTLIRSGIDCTEVWNRSEAPGEGQEPVSVRVEKCMKAVEQSRYPNSPSRPSKAMPGNRLKFSGLKIFVLDGTEHSFTKQQDCGFYSHLIDSRRN
jgi:hypothetical protein